MSESQEIEKHDTTKDDAANVDQEEKEEEEEEELTNENSIEKEPVDRSTPSSSSWSETDETALMLFVHDAAKGQSIDTDPLEDENEHLWSEISERFPGKTAINCLQRYAKLRLRELQNMRSGMTVTDAAGMNSSSSAASDGGNKRANDEIMIPEAKRVKVEGDVLSWTEDEVNLLRNAVSQYVNSEFVCHYTVLS